MKKLIALLLSAVLAVPMLFACGETGTQSGEPVPSEEESVDPKTVFVTPQKDMRGREFRVLCWDFGYGSNSILGYTGEVLYNEENADKLDSVDTAKKQVIDIVEDRFNCTIGGAKVNDVSTVNIVRSQHDSGIAEYDIVFDSPFTTKTLVAEQLLYNLYDIPTIDLTAPWWDQNSVNDLSLGGKLYFVAGDINTYDNQGTWCILFNKNLKESLGVPEDFYQLVRDDQWNFDKFTEICLRDGYTANTSGDNVLDEKDQWAFGTESYNMYVHLIAGGQKIAQKDENDMPYLTVSRDPETTVSMLQKVLDFYRRYDKVMCANFSNYTGKGFQNVWEETVHKAFVDGRELFYMCGLINVASFRTMKDEFGILPVPKYSPTQDDWHHTVSVQNSTVMSIPVGVENVEDIGTIVSALSEESKKYVTPAYYDVQLKYRDAKDAESGEMLDLIFSTRTFDLGATYNWGGILGQYMSESTDIASRFDSMIGTAEAELEKTVEAIEEAVK